MDVFSVCTQGVQPVKNMVFWHFREAVNDQAEYGSQIRDLTSVEVGQIEIQNDDNYSNLNID